MIAPIASGICTNLRQHRKIFINNGRIIPKAASNQDIHILQLCPVLVDAFIDGADALNIEIFRANHGHAVVCKNVFQLLQILRDRRGIAGYSR